MQKVEEIQYLKDLLDKISKKSKVVIYFRRQDKVAISLHSTALKMGISAKTVLPEIKGKALPYYYDYFAIYSNWAAVFGKERVVCRVFDKSEFIDGNLYRDFLNACDVPWLHDLVIPPVENESLNIEAQTFLLRLNQLLPGMRDKLKNINRGEIVRVLESNFSGSGATPSRSQAEEFYSMFKGSNEKLFEAYFSGRSSSLFDEDFSDLPDEEVEYSFKYKDALVIALTLLNFKK